MRVEKIQQIRDLQALIKTQEAALLDFVTSFVDTHHIFEINRRSLLLRYNSVVLSWLSEWARAFFDALHASAFDRSLEEIEAIETKKREELSAFLYLRIHLGLPVGIFNITYSYYFPAHKALLACAELVVSEEASVCQFLMPWVTEVIGGAIESDIKTSTENAQGKFLPGEFITSENQHSLIDVVGYFDYVRDEQTIAKKFSENNHRILHMKKELGTLCKSYIVMLLFRFSQTQDKDNFGYHLLRLATSLFERSEDRAGNREIASPLYRGVVRDFYEVWMSLPVERRVDIGRTRIDNYILEDQLLLLFDSENMIFEKDELNRITKITKDNTEPPLCVQIAANLFFGALHANPKWYEIPVKAGMEKTVLYTDEAFQQLREELFAHVRNPNRYLLTSQDSVISALQFGYLRDYEAFFKLASCVPVMSTFHLLKPMAHPNAYCTNLDQIFEFIYRIKNNAARWQCWQAFCAYWSAQFSDIDSVMMLYFFMLEDGNAIVYANLHALFGGKIKNYFSGSYSLSVNNLSHWCNQLSLDMQAVRFSFIRKIIEYSPILIAENNAFFKCILVCQTIVELKSLFELTLEHARHLLLPTYKTQRGARLLELMSLAEDQFRFVSQHSLNARLFCITLLNVVLPILISNRALDDLSSVHTNSCVDFFSKTTDDLLKSDVMNCKDPVEKVALIANAIEQKRRGKFLNSVKFHFAQGFFKKAKTIYDPVTLGKAAASRVGFCHAS